MGGLQRSPADGCGAPYETSADITAALQALAECSVRLESEPLKREVGYATQQMLQHVEGSCKVVVHALVNTLKENPSGTVAYDKLWALRHVGKQSEVSRKWMREDGGMAAIAAAMSANPGHERLLEEGAWLGYVLGGIDGLLELLQLAKAMPRDSAGTMAVQQATAWATFEVAKTQLNQGKAGPAEWPQSDTLVLLLVHAMQMHSSPGLELLRGCCFALKKLIKDQPLKGSLFLRNQGGEALLAAIRLGQRQGSAGPHSVQVAAMWLMAALVTGNARAALEFRSLGALDCVVECGLAMPGEWEDTMWTLGQVGGPLAIVQVMTRSSCPTHEALCAGLRVLAKLTWEPVEESLQQQFPEVVKELLGTLSVVASSLPQELVHTVHALGGALKVCAPHVQPGRLGEVDKGVSLLVEAMRESQNPEVSKAACTCIGHIATSAACWRTPLQAALPHLVDKWREAGDTKEGCDDLRDLMWATGAIAGLAALLDAMRQRPDCAGLQLASIHAIVDVLESDDLWGGSPSQGSCSGTGPNEIAEGLRLVAVAMSKHRAVLNIQMAGCNALTVLCDALPPNAEIPQDAPAAVLAALRRFPCKMSVVCSVCASLRRMLEPRACSENPISSVERTVALVRRLDNPANDLKKVMQDFTNPTDEMLGDCLFVYSLLEGVPALLQALVEEGNSLQKRSAGVQVLCELFRSFRGLLAPHAKDIVVAAGILAEQVKSRAQAAPGREGDVDKEVLDLQGRCELLMGLLSQL